MFFSFEILAVDDKCTELIGCNHADQTADQKDCNGNGVCVEDSSSPSLFVICECNVGYTGEFCVCLCCNELCSIERIIQQLFVDTCCKSVSKTARNFKT